MEQIKNVFITNMKSEATFMQNEIYRFNRKRQKNLPAYLSGDVSKYIQLRIMASTLASSLLSWSVIKVE